jgi:hypothetical protein
MDQNIDLTTMCCVRFTGLKAEGKTIIVDVVMQVKRAHQETAPETSLVLSNDNLHRRTSNSLGRHP